MFLLPCLVTFLEDEKKYFAPGTKLNLLLYYYYSKNTSILHSNKIIKAWSPSHFLVGEMSRNMLTLYGLIGTPYHTLGHRTDSCQPNQDVIDHDYGQHSKM
jgi:hypothetical protein